MPEVPPPTPEPLAAPAPDPRAAAAAWYLRSAHRRLWMLPLTAGLVVVVALLLLRGTAEDPAENLKASQAALLALAPPAVPKEENAAEDYALAQKAKVPYSSSAALGSPRNDPSTFITKESRLFENPDVQAYVAKNAAAIQHLYAGAAKARCNWGLNYGLGINMLMPHLAQTRDSARLLAIHARASAHAGDHRAAARSIATIYKLAQHVNSDPVLISSLVCIACASIADGTIEAIVAWDTPDSSEDLAAYRKAVWLDRHWQTAAARSLACERAMNLYTLDGMASGSMPMPGFPGFWAGGFLWYGSDRHCYSAVMDEFIARSLRGEWHKDEDMSELIARHQTGPAIMTRMVLPVLARFGQSLMVCEERGRVVDAGLAFLQFRAKYQRDARSLDELVPEFLAAVPKGVLSPVPLRMRVDPKGVEEIDRLTQKRSWRDPNTIRIYALGPNGKDDGGHNNQWGAPDSGGYPDADDTVFRVPPLKKSAAAPGGKAP
ncbi:MAG: hypothetical protein ABSE73_21930 [Planctomycetota bacterium]